MSTVWQSITAIMAEMPAIDKGGTAAAAQGGYAYRGIEQITSVLQPLLAKHGVFIAPSARLLWVNASPGMKTDNWTDTALEVHWTICGADGSTIEAQTIGIGRDNADKGANKAMSQAFKYLLLDLFCIADTKDDADGVDYSAHVETERRQPPKTAGQLVFDRLAGQSPETQAALRARKADFKDAKLSAPSFDADPDWLDAVVQVLDNPPG